MVWPKPATPPRPLFVVVAVLVGLLAAACAGAASSNNDANSDGSDTEVPHTDDSAAAESSDADSIDTAAALLEAVSQDDLTRFIAATESAVVDTSVEGIVLDGPEIYVGIAQASCARFTQGDTLEQVVDDYLDTTTGSIDDEQLIGAILGAAVETICPEHRAIF